LKKFRGKKNFWALFRGVTYLLVKAEKSLYTMQKKVYAKLERIMKVGKSVIQIIKMLYDLITDVMEKIG
jgi:hypothetical protein